MAFSGDADFFREVVQKISGYSFLPTRNEGYSGYISQDGINIAVISQITKYDESRNQYPSLNILHGYNCTEPIKFPNNLEDFDRQVEIILNLTNLILGQVVKQKFNVKKQDEYERMELPLFIGDCT